MLKCEKCGKDLINEKQMDFINKKLGNEKAVLLCEKCKKVAVAENFKEVYKDHPPK